MSSQQVLMCGEFVSIININIGLAISLVSKKQNKQTKILLKQPFQQKTIYLNSFHLTPHLISNYFYKLDLENFSVETLRNRAL